MLTTEWGFDPSKVPEARGNNASFIDAWETAVTRITKEREEAAVARVFRREICWHCEKPSRTTTSS